MPEDPKEICFVTERVTTSLANQCNNFTNLPMENIPKGIKEKNLSAFEVTCGIVRFAGSPLLVDESVREYHVPPSNCQACASESCS